MNATSLNRLAMRITDLCRVLAEFEGVTRGEMKTAMEAAFVPSAPTRSGVRGGAPLDGQLVGMASNAEQVATQCDEAAESYERLAQQAAIVLNSKVLKSLGAATKAGKDAAEARREECKRLAASCNAELERRQKAREEAMAELEKAKKVTDEVQRIKQELATMRATFS